MRCINQKLIEEIILEIKLCENITERELANRFLVSERTIRRYIKKLKGSNRVELINNGKKKKWKIIDKNLS